MSHVHPVFPVLRPGGAPCALVPRPGGLPEYELYTAQALDGRGQVLYTVTRSVIYENELI